MWRKSTFSSNGTDCVEVRGDLRAVRDSKNVEVKALSVDVRRLVEFAKRG